MKKITTFFLSLVALCATAQIPEYPNDAGKFLTGTATWSVPSISSNATAYGRAVLSTTTLAPTAATNFLVDFAASPAGFIQATNHVAITGVTNNIAGATYRLLILNASGSGVNLTVPSTAFQSADVIQSTPTVITNGTGAIIDIVGYGTDSTNTTYRFRRLVK